MRMSAQVKWRPEYDEYREAGWRIQGSDSKIPNKETKTKFQLSASFKQIGLDLYNKKVPHAELDSLWLPWR